MHSRPRVFLAFLFAAASACGTLGESVKVARASLAAAPRPAGCDLQFLWNEPGRPYDDLGELTALVRVPPRGGAQEMLRNAACDLGADAVIVLRHQRTRTTDQELVVGTAIKFLAPAPPPPAEPAPPAAPGQPAAPRSASDLDL